MNCLLIHSLVFSKSPINWFENPATPLPVRSQFAQEWSGHCCQLDWSLFCRRTRAGAFRTLLPRNHCRFQQQVGGRGRGNAPVSPQKWRNIGNDSVWPHTFSGLLFWKSLLFQWRDFYSGDHQTGRVLVHLQQHWRCEQPGGDLLGGSEAEVKVCCCPTRQPLHFRWVVRADGDSDSDQFRLLVKRLSENSNNWRSSVWKFI